MYLMHMFFLAPIASFFVNGNQAEPLIPIWAAIPCIALLTYLCCVIIIVTQKQVFWHLKVRVFYHLKLIFLPLAQIICILYLYNYPNIADTEYNG